VSVIFLVAMVYLNLSETLVRYHNFPSLLQIVVLAFAFYAWLQRDTADLAVVIRQRITILAAVYLLIVFASTTWALNRHYADERVVQFAKAFAIYLLATLLMRTPRRLMQGIVTLVAAAAGLGLLILWQVATGHFENELGGLARVKQAHIYGDVFQPRVAGPIGDPNFFARMLLIAIPPAVMLAFSAREKWQRRIALVAALVITATVATTYSRGAMLAVAVMAVMLLHMLHVRWRSTFAVAVCLAAVLLALPKTVTQRFITIEEILPSDEVPLHPDSSFAERKLLMNVAWVMFGANPVGGVGIGNYTARYDDYVGATSSAARQYNDPNDKHFPHNLPLEVAAETGIIGLIAFAMLLWACWQAMGSSPLRVSLVGFVVAGLFLHLSEPRTLFLLLAFAATIERIGKNPAVEPAP
jgi:putative inorganic carbon (HCO3(-)) transporter